MSNDNWFPGHMARALREMQQAVASSDVIIAVLDARAPSATEHPLVSELAGHRPVLRVLNKADLADPNVTKNWVRAFRPQIAVPVSLGEKASRAVDQIPRMCRDLTSSRKKTHSLTGIVIGIPNVGKSTLINRLKGRRVLVARDQPGVTRASQLVTVAPGFVLRDTPGVLWPSSVDLETSNQLAAIGTIPEGLVDTDGVAVYVLNQALNHSRLAIQDAYGIAASDRPAREILAEIARRRGHLGAGGVLDLTRTSRAIIQDFRTGRLGRISLEQPKNS